MLASVVSGLMLGMPGSEKARQMATDPGLSVLEPSKDRMQVQWKGIRRPSTCLGKPIIPQKSHNSPPSGAGIE